MSQDVFDLVVRVINRLSELEAVDRHPRFSNSFKYGVLQGLRVGIFRLEFLFGEEPDLLSMLTHYGRLDLLLERINQNVDGKHAYRPEWLEPTRYRSSDTKELYFEGIELGYSYVFELHQALGDNNTKLTSHMVREIRKEIAEF